MVDDLEASIEALYDIRDEGVKDEREELDDMIMKCEDAYKEETGKWYIPLRNRCKLNGEEI